MSVSAIDEQNVVRIRIQFYILNNQQRCSISDARVPAFTIIKDLNVFEDSGLGLGTGFETPLVYQFFVMVPFDASFHGHG